MRPLLFDIDMDQLAGPVMLIAHHPAHGDVELPQPRPTVAGQHPVDRGPLFPQFAADRISLPIWIILITQNLQVVLRDFFEQSPVRLAKFLLPRSCEPPVKGCASRAKRSPGNGRSLITRDRSIYVVAYTDDRINLMIGVPSPKRSY
jgi:hypothetical protein